MIYTELLYQIFLEGLLLSPAVWSTSKHWLRQEYKAVSAEGLVTQTSPICTRASCGVG